MPYQSPVPTPCDPLIAAAHGLRPLTVTAAREYGCLGRLLVVADWRDGRMPDLETKAA